MANTEYILIYLPLIIITAIILLAILSREEKQYFIKQCLVFYTVLLGWQVFETLFFVMPTPAGILAVFEWKLPFVAFSSVAVFFMIAGFYRQNRVLPKYLPWLLSIIPAITTVLAITSPLHSLLLESFAVVSLPPETSVQAVRGVWYYVHYIYSMSLLAASLSMAVVNYKKLPGAYRSGSLFVICSLVLFCMCNIVEITNVNTTPVDFNLIGASICGILFYLAILAGGRADYLHISKQQVFSYLDEAVFILSGEGRLLDANTEAWAWLKLFNNIPEDFYFGDFLSRLESAGSIKRVPVDGGRAEELYIIGTDYPLIYKMQTRTIVAGDSRQEGRFVILSDVTNNRLFMERLRALVGEDALTGISNRYRYQELLRKYDRPFNLPLSVVMGDVNGLKKVNDTYGHHMGDKLLITIAEVLEGCCPEGGKVARIGGDEFIMLLPLCTERDAQGVMRCVREELKGCKDLPLPPSIALGTATKNREGENINALINEADMKMYKNKH